jgi:pimeloyl-ACP methyl ester carboxylesterase
MKVLFGVPARIIERGRPSTSKMRRPISYN